MKNLGNKLLQARNAMGLSVRDAADATRLRADVIENMEAGEFTFKLPEIYKRGFLRIYAAFLKLDPNGLVDEYRAASEKMAEDDGRRRGNILSRMANATPLQAAAPAREIDVPSESDGSDSRFDEPENGDTDMSAKYLKIAAVFGGVILAVAVIILVVSGIVNRAKAPEENSEISYKADIPTQPAVAATPAQMPADAEIALALTALADTYVLVYPDVKTPDGKPVDTFYTGPMQAGERKEFKSKVPVMVKLTDAERIKIERNGKALDLKGAKGIRLFRIGAK